MVRGHENYLENNAQFFFAVLTNWLVLKNFSTVFVLALLNGAARVLYALGYSLGPSYRTPGFLVGLLTTLALHGTIVFHVLKAFKLV